MDADDEIGHIEPIVLKGNDREEWLSLIPSKEVEQKYSKRKYRKRQSEIKNMKIKLGIKYDFEDVDLNDDEREKKKLNIFKKIIKKKDKKPKVIHRLQKPERRRMQLRAYIYQARNLENADMSGLSDGYLVTRFCGTSAKTKVIEDHIDPKWYQALILDVQVPIPLKYAPKIYCEIYDHDDFSKDQSLGRFSVIAENIWTVFDDKKIDEPKPKWYGLCDAEHNTVSGEVLCAFELIDIQQSDIKVININPPCKMIPKVAHCITLGLRDIQSIFGVHKPYLEFESSGSLYKTDTSNRPDSRNPNFCQILKVEVMLPVEKIFLPNLNLTIKDSLFGGLIKRKIGFASIELEDILYNADLFKYTEFESDQKELRDEAQAELELIENKQNEEKASEYKDDEKDKSYDIDIDNKNKYDINDVGGQQIVNTDPSSQDSKENEERQPLIKSAMTGMFGDDIDNDSNIAKIPLHASKNCNNYEQNKKNEYDLTKVLPDYMKNRPIYGDELEDQMDLKPFLQIPFFSGKNKRNVGFFKGFITFSDSKKDMGSASDNLLKQITKPVPLYLRLYILEGLKLVPQDTNGLADPYLIIKIGDEKISTRNDHFDNTLNPGFYYGLELAVELPGPARVTIEVWDWDGIGDDMIGSTIIDIEDRWYSKKWRDLELKPVEERTLWNPQSSVSQGKLKLWMELLEPNDSKKYPMINIKPPPPDPYELRVIVWECKDCPIMDTTTNMNDLYITGGLISNNEDEEDLQQTDLHFRSQNGKGSFNWRMKFPIKLPKRKFNDYPTFQIQIWDKDFFSPSDNIAEAIIPLQPFLRYCEKYSKEKRCVLTLSDEDKFWIDLSDKGGGKVKLSIELLPNKIAHLLPAGFGRKDPNNNPHLPEPIGRAKFSLLNPCQSLRLLLGDRLCCKIILIFCCLICIALLIFITPNLISAITADLITGM